MYFCRLFYFCFRPLNHLLLFLRLVLRVFLCFCFLDFLLFLFCFLDLLPPIVIKPLLLLLLLAGKTEKEDRGDVQKGGQGARGAD